MLHTDLFYALALQKVEGVGSITAKKLINALGSPENVFKTSKTQLLKIDGIGEIVYKNLQKKDIFKHAENELNFIEKDNISFCLFNDSSYPYYLKQCSDAPFILFHSGNINLDNKKMISIVGTRQITNYGIEFLRSFMEDIAPLNPVIVSGFAYGVDIMAHQLALEYQLQTIGVLAHGLNQIYPKSHKKYMAKMLDNGGFMTEFWSNTNPDKENFVKRNRIVAGMCEATLVVESGEQGGSLITAKMANDYSREVFAVPGRVKDKYSVGCNNLIKTQRAHLVTQAADLIYILNWDLKNKNSEKIIQKQLFIELTDEEQIIYNFLKNQEKEMMDSIAIACDYPIYKVSSILLNMELKGVVRPLPGKYFEVI